jgi:hypothetical protein
MALPLSIQAALTKSILGFDKTLAGKPSIRIMVVFDREPAKLLEQIDQAFVASGLTTAGAGRVAELEGRAGQMEVLYVLPSAASPQLAEYCTRRGLLTISGHPAIVRRGDASIGLGVAAGKPKILIHVPRLAREGHQLSANLLAYAERIGG